MHYARPLCGPGHPLAAPEFGVVLEGAIAAASTAKHEAGTAGRRRGQAAACAHVPERTGAIAQYSSGADGDRRVQQPPLLGFDAATAVGNCCSTAARRGAGIPVDNGCQQHAPWLLIAVADANVVAKQRTQSAPRWLSSGPLLGLARSPRLGKGQALAANITKPVVDAGAVRERATGATRHEYVVVGEGDAPIAVNRL